MEKGAFFTVIKKCNNYFLVNTLITQRGYEEICLSDVCMYTGLTLKPRAGFKFDINTIGQTQ